MSTPQMPAWPIPVEVPGDSATVAATAAASIVRQAAAAVAARGAFRLCLAGGSTPLAAYRLLTTATPVATATPQWAAWHLYHGDERCLPADDAGRNSVAALRAGFDSVPIPPAQVHAIPAERGPQAAADAYGPVVAAALPFDLVLLGIGEDGHTASLFPAHPWPADDVLVVPVHGAPKPPPERVSLTARALTDCRALRVLVTGAGKRDALRRWRAGESLPIVRLLRALPPTVDVLMLLDADAAG